MTDAERRTLAEIFAADDQWRVEHEQWMATREAERTTLVRKSGPDGVMYREHENNALAGAPDGADDVFTGVLSEAQRDLLARSLGKIIASMRREWQGEHEAALVERDRKIAILEGEIKETKAMLGAALALFGGAVGATKMLARPPDDGDAVIDLPDWRKRHA